MISCFQNKCTGLITGTFHAISRRALRLGVRLLLKSEGQRSITQGAEGAKGSRKGVDALIRPRGLISADNPPSPEPDTAFRTPRFGLTFPQPKVRKRFAARETIHQPPFLIQASPAPSRWFLPDLISLLQHVRRTYPSPPGNFIRHDNQIGKERTLLAPCAAPPQFV